MQDVREPQNGVDELGFVAHATRERRSHEPLRRRLVVRLGRRRREASRFRFLHPLAHGCSGSALQARASVGFSIDGAAVAIAVFALLFYGRVPRTAYSFIICGEHATWMAARTRRRVGWATLIGRRFRHISCVATLYRTCSVSWTLAAST